ncbi:MAG: hypothetical protein II551_00440 [Paludibacteraceae bacterium]|nr:hypothetical protein [Paludibacteraceae bacterium]
MKQSYIYITVMIAVLLCVLTVFYVFPRPTFSELERRDLTELPMFPSMESDSLQSGAYTAEISRWFSDTEPFREELLQLSMTLDQYMGLKIGSPEEQVTFHAADQKSNEDADMEELGMVTPTTDDREIEDYKNKQNATEAAKIAHAGIIVCGPEGKVRAMSAYHGVNGGNTYARVCNEYKKAFPDVNVYCMVIPTAVSFYCPDVAKQNTKSELATIRNTYSLLDDSVKAVDIYTVLGNHAQEDIYLRTDHHWAPLGAYYAAERFAKAAEVPYRPLSEYNKHVVHDFVGTMYGFSHDISVKQSPEDFVYYTPKDSAYQTTYIVYTVNKSYKVTAEGAAYKGKFFGHFKDGSSAAYCVFMGGDSKITQVRTSQKNGRRLLILKDSFGNALAGYLFGSFEEVHVVDGRYFTKNMKEYVRDNSITDILFCNNVFKVYAGGDNYRQFLKQTSWPYKGRNPAVPKTVSVSQEQ